MIVIELRAGQVSFRFIGNSRIMQRGSIPWLAALAGLALFVSGCNGGELSEIELFFKFIRALDPKTVLRIEWSRSLRQPCSNQWNVVVRCKMVSLFGRPVTEIRLQNLNLSGILDAETLCKLPILCVLIFAKNRIRGTVPDSIADCKSLMHLDLSNNLLTGSLPTVALSKLKNLKRFDISDNHCGSTDPQLNREARRVGKYWLVSEISQANAISKGEISNKRYAFSPAPEDVSHGKQSSKNDDNPRKHWQSWMVVLAMGVTFVLLLIFFTRLKAVQAAKDTEITRELALSLSPPKSPHVEIVVEEKAEERHSELVFFIEKHERFGLEELLEASADLRWQGHCSSLYGVRLKNNATFAVKRLKKLQVSFEEFGQTMRKIGNLKHQNILSLVGYNSSKEKKLLIYRFQNNGSLLTLFNDYIEGKRNLPWKLRLSIAIGIARGLNFIYQWPEDGEIIPHGNIKPSNIMLDEKEEPLISEYGIAKFLVSNKARFFNSSSYAAPEKRLTEQADVYSFGVILLELLTGKFAEMQKNGLDLPKWVKAKVREEWTGEVFDKEIEKFEMYGFSLLNISLKCVSELPGDRPSISEVLEKIQEVVTAQEDISSSSTNSVESI
ncbi:probable inactive receptor kinase At3g08680 [Coffea arabica]|uniref:Probable inactive receptor kinase At3g08680 n=1 Tax=Coffea arabica TaxID=13443 RepID=A0A6P6S8E6_COFAR|nr:putative inactive receptor-like protein kinase At1g64210 [Coffea arabica]